jgi:large subunit ribosomal protein L21
MYAIVEVGGRQWKVQAGSQLSVNRLSAEVGSQHLVERVLLAHDGQQVQVGRPYLEGAQVVCEVLAHPRGPKTISYHYRRRENWRKTVGHRQALTRLVVKEIQLAGSAVAPSVTAEIAPVAKVAKPRAKRTTRTAQTQRKA